MIYPGKTEHLLNARHYDPRLPTGERTGISVPEQTSHFLLRIPAAPAKKFQLVRKPTNFHAGIVNKCVWRNKGGYFVDNANGSDNALIVNNN